MLDRIGITATSLCALHCILLPILLPILPMFGLSILGDHEWEHVFLLFTAVLGTAALFSGYKRYHRKFYPLVLLYLGVGIYWIKHDFAESSAMYFILTGATLIVASHIINIKLCNASRRCDNDCSN
jgi:hypothetical protein|tara:strand:+ start:111 stop:488 length:378 start_codon:yes stop_codon:yes gene_type:complete